MNSQNAITATQVKALVNGYSAILAEANGSTADQQDYDPTGSDYLAVFVGTGSTYQTAIEAMLKVSESASLLTDVISNKSATQVDSLSELNSIALVVTKIYELEKLTLKNDAAYSGISGGALQVSELTSLGLDTSNLTNTYYSNSVLTKRLNNVYDAIIDVDHTSPSSRQTMDSLLELQTLINNTSVITA